MTFANDTAVEDVTEPLRTDRRAATPIRSRSFGDSMRLATARYQSSPVRQRSAFSPFEVRAATAPVSLATVGTPTSEASIHLFSDFASLKRLASSGARLMSVPAISLGNRVQGTNPSASTRPAKGINSGGRSRIPTIFRRAWGKSVRMRTRVGRIILTSSLWVMLPLKYPSTTLPSPRGRRRWNASFDSATIFSEATFRLTNTSGTYLASSVASGSVVVMAASQRRSVRRIRWTPSM